MSWDISSAQNGSIITHYGIPGMKWGVRKKYTPTGKIAKSAQKKGESLTQRGLSVRKNAQSDSVQSTLKNAGVKKFGERVVTKNDGTGVRGAFRNQRSYDAFASNKVNWNKTEYSAVMAPGRHGGSSGASYRVLINGVDEDGDPIEGAIAFDTEEERDEYLKTLDKKKRAYNATNWSRIYSEINANRTSAEKVKRKIDAALKKVGKFTRKAAKKAAELVESGQKALAKLFGKDKPKETTPTVKDKRDKNDLAPFWEAKKKSEKPRRGDAR